MSGKYNQNKRKFYNEIMRTDRKDLNKTNKLLYELYNIDGKGFKEIRFVECGNDIIASIFTTYMFHMYNCNLTKQ